MKKRNPARAARRHAEQYGGEYAEWIRSQPCEACKGLGQLSRTCAAHAGKTRGAGGKAGDMVPLCSYHERLWHVMGRRTFDVVYGTDLKALAARLWSEYTGGEL